MRSVLFFTKWRKTDVMLSFFSLFFVRWVKLSILKINTLRNKPKIVCKILAQYL